MLRSQALLSSAWRRTGALTYRRGLNSNPTIQRLTNCGVRAVAAHATALAVGAATCSSLMQARSLPLLALCETHAPPSVATPVQRREELQQSLSSNNAVSRALIAVRLVLRAISLGALLLPPLLLLLPLLLFTHTADERWCRWFDAALLRALERGGPCLIKLGQWASTRPDLLPPALCATLASLHHRVPEHSLAFTRTSIAAAFGVPVDSLFRDISPRPMGSGCIAQVHAATALDGESSLELRSDV